MAVMIVSETDGMVEIFPTGLSVDARTYLTERKIPNLVSVDLNRDVVRVARLTFSVDADQGENRRATAMTGWLCGSYVRVNGPAFFELDSDLAIDAMTEVA